MFNVLEGRPFKNGIHTCSICGKKVGAESYKDEEELPLGWGMILEKEACGTCCYRAKARGIQVEKPERIMLDIWEKEAKLRNLNIGTGTGVIRKRKKGKGNNPLFE